jgi:uncharacterized protein (TIGR04255 family)
MNKKNTIPSPPYPKPPITEAVIALHFSAPLDDKAIEALATKHKERFPRIEDMMEVSASFNVQTGFATSTSKKVGRKFQTADGTCSVIILNGQFAVSHRAPYRGWEALVDDVQRLWGVVTKKTKQKSITHVSTRYINRVDVPVNNKGGVDLHDYFRAGLSLPPFSQVLALESFNLSCALTDSHNVHKFVLNLGAIQSPLIDYLSFLIDIDCVTIDQTPKKDADIWKIVGSLRQCKNDMFESCITDRTRALFQ